MKLWRKLVKVHADLQTLSYTMHSYNFVSRSVEFLIEALQEQVTIVEKLKNRKVKKRVPKTDLCIQIEGFDEYASIGSYIRPTPLDL